MLLDGLAVSQERVVRSTRRRRPDGFFWCHFWNGVGMLRAGNVAWGMQHRAALLHSIISRSGSVMERPHLISGPGPRRMGVFIATCALHAAAIYWIGTQVMTRQSPLWTALEVSFVPTERKEPPPPTTIPVVLSDAFAERQLIDIPAPDVELAVPHEPSEAIHAPPLPEQNRLPESSLEEGKGYGPLTKPRVVSGPKFPQDRYPRASIRHKESGRTVLKICISMTGSVDSVDVAKTSGYPRLDAAAVDMALDYVFSPATRDGTPVPVCLPYGIDFRLGVGGLRRNR